MVNLTHKFLTELPELCLEWSPALSPDPQLVVLNTALAAQLGLDTNELASPEWPAIFAGNHVPAGAVPVALGYAGHQFGNYSPRLGDGRALLLGELVAPDGRAPDGRMVDVHLKGSGRTPFARGGDGKATIGPMLREYVISEALHALGVPTTRSLAVVTTGEAVHREGPEPGAILTRIAASHIRVGTFEYAVRLGGSELVRRLADHAIERHYPHLLDPANVENPYRELLAAVVDSQAELIARWLLVGFVHGVMNTDNMAISGEGIDYGPCAFMDRYDPRSVFSSIDHAGRYAYGNQAPVAAWNLARLAETMLDLIADSTDVAVATATEIVNGFPARFNAHWRTLMIRKIGLTEVPADDESLLDDLPAAMEADGLDWTTTFRDLADSLRPRDPAAGISAPRGRRIDEWTKRWRIQLDREGGDLQLVADQMDSVNPIYIPRNHLVDSALRSSTTGDYGTVIELIDVLGDPFTKRPGLERFAEPAPEAFNSGFRTFCGT